MKLFVITLAILATGHVYAGEFIGYYYFSEEGQGFFVIEHCPKFLYPSLPGPKPNKSMRHISHPKCVTF